MPNEIRRRYNFQSGTTSGTVLVGATTLTSAGLTGLSAVGSSEYTVLILDPGGTGSGPEVIYVTAHTASSDSATIVRAREGSSAVQHGNGTQWIHAPTAADYAVIGDNNDQPSTGGLPYEGQFYVDTTNDELEIYNGTGWVTFPYGAWTAYTPTLGGTSASIGNAAETTNFGRYIKIGRTVHFQIRIRGGSTTNLSSDTLTLTLPFAAYDPGDYRVPIGLWYMLDPGVFSYSGLCYIDHETYTSNDKIALLYGNTTVSEANPIAGGFTTNDELVVQGTYEAAS
jgi:hypothetical protein